MFKKKDKNSLAKTILEVFFTLIVAYLLSLIVSFVLYFIFANIGKSTEYASYTNFISGVVFGVTFGFKLKEIVSRKK